MCGSRVAGTFLIPVVEGTNDGAYALHMERRSFFRFFKSSPESCKQRFVGIHLIIERVYDYDREPEFGHILLMLQIPINGEKHLEAIFRKLKEPAIGCVAPTHS